MINDPTTLAFLAAGFLGSEQADAASKLGLSRIDVVERLTALAPALDALYEQHGEDYEGCFAYDVAEPMGGWYALYMDEHGQLPNEEEFLEEGCRYLGLEPRSPEAKALDAIQAVLSGQEWNPDHLDAVAAIVRGTGREIKDCDDTLDDAA
ncbi:hypothetical protein [Halomonas sp. E19]|jgi:hypothetical protein|uniref:hypothetical protein n=1 Tax=Halomonas sp. E19 TaxID=3397247 RepID=UPI0040333719